MFLCVRSAQSVLLQVKPLEASLCCARTARIEGYEDAACAAHLACRSWNGGLSGPVEEEKADHKNAS